MDLDVKLLTKLTREREKRYRKKAIDVKIPRIEDFIERVDGRETRAVRGIIGDGVTAFEFTSNRRDGEFNQKDFRSCR